MKMQTACEYRIRNKRNSQYQTGVQGNSALTAVVSAFLGSLTSKDARLSAEAAILALLTF